jgi:carbonic anhydrase
MAFNSTLFVRASRLALVFFFSAFVALAPVFASGEISAEDALAMLLRGNDRFVGGRTLEKDFLRERPKLAAGQKPYAIVLACADSRVPPELLFDESLGRIFVIRVAGNIVDPAILGSIEYAVEHLHVPLLFVLGHESCGAVKAKLSGGHFTPNIDALLARISPAVNKVRTLDLDEKSALNKAIKENVSYQMQMVVYESEVLREAVRKKHLKVAGGVYDLDTGKVELLATDLALQNSYTEENQLSTNKSEEKEKEAVEPPKSKHIEKKAEKEAETTAPARTVYIEKKTEKQEGEKIIKIEKSDPRSTEEKKTDNKNQKASPNSTSNETEGKRATQAESNLTNHVVSQNQSSISGPVNRDKSFQSLLRAAYENKSDVLVKASLLMRDEQDRCATFDCRNLPAGETVKILCPVVLNIGGRPSIKVKYKGQTFYLLANTNDFEFTNN